MIWTWNFMTFPNFYKRLFCWNNVLLFFLYRSSSSSLCTVFYFISSNIDQVLSINPGLPFLEELIDLVNSVIISQTTLLRWLKVTSAIKLFFAITQPLKLCLILEISRFFCICEVHRFWNLWHHHKHCYIMKVTLTLTCFES